jgi:hypothetical protein
MAGSGGIAPPRPSHSKTAHDHLQLPDGRRVGDLRNGEIVGLLTRLGTPGVSPFDGRAANIAAYAAHVDAIKAEAAQNGLAAWLDKFKDAS